jgi:protein disulfide-isomerase
MNLGKASVILLFGLAGLFYYLFVIRADRAADALWTDDFPAARLRAQSENKRILLFFSGSDWCSFCRKVQNEVLRKPEFIDYAKENLVLVIVDFPRGARLPAETVRRNAALADEFKVDGFPTFVLIDAYGTELARISGYAGVSPEVFLQLLQKPANR